MKKCEIITQKDTPNIKKILVCNAISITEHYIKSLVERGYAVYHLRTFPHIKKNNYFVNVENTEEEMFNFAIEKNSNYFSGCYDLADYNSMDDCINDLKGKFDFAIPGAEPGLDTAEKICYGLGLLPNDPKKIMERRNKHLMQKALKDAGINYIKYSKSNNVNEILDFYIQNGSKPIVLKELMGSATYNVFVCNSKDEVIDKFNAIVNSISRSGTKNTDVLAEEYIKGTEMILNCISRNGVHSISAIFEYKKILMDNKYPIYDSVSSVQASEKIKKAAKYIYKCLDAVGIKNGPSHSEFFIQENGEPVLVETAGRQGGVLGATNSFKKLFNEYEYEYVLNCFLSQKAFDDFNSLAYNPNGYYITKFLISTGEFDFDPQKCKELLTKIPGVVDIDFYNHFVKAKKLKKTIDLSTSPGGVTIYSKDKTIAIEASNTITDLCFNHPKEFYKGTCFI
jgi:hypothetical protein